MASLNDGKTLNFCDSNHVLGKQLMLTEKFTSVPNPAFKSIQLYDHQAVVIAAMLNIESMRTIKVVPQKATWYNENNHAQYTNHVLALTTGAMVLSGEFGSGKTIELLGLILINPVPKAFPTLLNSALKYDSNDVFHTEIVRKYTGKDALIRPNIIVVGSSVLVQWEDAIKNFTNLKYLVVGDVFGLKTFLALYNARQLHKYDIILLKNGTVTGNFVLPGETTQKSTRHLITTMATILHNNCVSRLIIDDFDTINIPAGTCGINALFTIYVSATRNYTYDKTYDVKFASVEEYLSNHRMHLCGVNSDTYLFSNFNVATEAAFTERSTRVTYINKYKYVFKNPDDNYMRLMGVMGDEARQIMEALNAGALGEACDALGIGATSIADIFQRMLDDKYTKFINCKDVIDVICKTKKLLGGLNEHPKGKRPSEEKLKTYEHSIRGKHVPAIKYYSTLANELVDTLGAEYNTKLETDGRAIERVIENARGGDCQICCLPLSDGDATIIVRCCGLIVCDMCGIKGNQISVKYNDKTKSNELFGNCANCKAFVNPKKDLIYLDKNIDIEKLLTARGDEVCTTNVNKSVEKTPIEDMSEPIEVKKVNPKLKCLLDIINRANIPERRNHHIDIPHLLKGTIDIPMTAGTPCKMLVFANYNESLRNIETYLKENNITYMRLEGTSREKANTVAQFRTHAQVLLINSQQTCAGLNLEFCTDIVFFHKLINENIEAQVVGRGQRIMRKVNLQLHYLMFDNEEAIRP